ncbi:hypothetical protein OIU79_016880 [Salix purpurea]|uniref:Uncharacterized protein n=1 Tax=Salix purpurea TaxID=77065 RepID=A0A9Q0PFR3_SALPP|nr:hypothetical protein OIU79_016880 [Salix purpurea]
MSVNEEPLSSGYRRRSSSGMPTPCFLYMSILSDPEGCSFCILDIEKAPIPELPSNEEAVGVITTEDVIKELLREEILDGTDEYVKIHNRGSDQVSFLQTWQCTRTGGGHFTCHPSYAVLYLLAGAYTIRQQPMRKKSE